MFGGIAFESERIDKFRERVRQMSAEELIRQGKLASDLCNVRKPPEGGVQQLKALQEEYRRRHPKIAWSVPVLVSQTRA